MDEIKLNDVFYDIKLNRRALTDIIVLGRRCILRSIEEHGCLDTLGLDALQIHKQLRELNLDEFDSLLIDQKNLHDLIDERRKRVENHV